MTDHDDDLDHDDDDLDDGPAGPPQVAQSEHDLIMMARAIVMGPESDEDIWSMLCATRSTAPKIGPSAARMLEETLGQAWRAVWLRGGTKPRASHTGTKGRLWERATPTPLAFTGATLALLRWLVSTAFAAPLSTIKALPAAPLAMGDQLIIYLALDKVSTTPALRVLIDQPFVQASPLAWLGFAAALAAAPGTNGRPTVPPAAAFDALTSGAGAVILDGLCEELAGRWRAAELAKRGVVDPTDLIRLGAVQDAVIESLFAACDRAGRRDLASFVLDAVAPLIVGNQFAAPEQLDPTTPLSQRAAARLGSGALLRALLRWSSWDDEHRGVRFIDDGYASSQVLLHRFERIGSAGVARVNGWLSTLAGLAPTTPSDTV
jgi:hypothetical protein